MRRRVALTVLGLAIFATAATALVDNGRRWRAMPAAPRRGTLAEAVARAAPTNWVLVDGDWRCEASFGRGSARYVPLDDGSAEVLVAFDSAFRCPPRAPVAGVLEREKLGPVVFTYRGPDDARAGVIICAVLALFGAFIAGSSAFRED